MTKRIELIEIDIKRCSLEYGVSPCTAEVGVTGSEKCYNCRTTCQDLANIDEQFETLRFNKPSSNMRFDLDTTPNISIPNIQSVSYTPPELMLGESIGVRATLRASFKDHPSPDTDNSGDKYRSERSYDPYSVGSYFGKLRARYPSLKNYPMRWIVGTDEQLIDDMETRHFVIESVSGPTTSGDYTINAKDVLKLTGGDQSVCPEITAKTFSEAFSDTDLGAIAFQDDPFLDQMEGYLVLNGTEIVRYRQEQHIVTLRWSLVLLSRGEFGTEPVDNPDGDEVDYQRVQEFFGLTPAEILDELMSYAGIGSQYYSFSDWQNESQNYIGRLYTAYIAEPTPVSKLINELLVSTASTMWWDNQSQKIRWQVLREPSSNQTVFNEQHYLKDSLNISDDYSKRVSRVFVYFGQKNPLRPVTELENYSSRALRLEVESEALFDNKPAYKTITSRWIPAAARTTAERLGDLILQRYSIPPRKVGLRLMRDTPLEVPQLGGAYSVSSFWLQNFDGSSQSIPFQVTSLIPSNTTYTVRGEEIRFNNIIIPDDPNNVPISLDVSANNINLREVYDSIAIPPTSDTVVNITISDSVVIGSSDSRSPAIKTGDWPAGATVNLINNGFIVGRGGDGGNGASISNARFSRDRIEYVNFVDATDGSDGGDALHVTYDLNLTNNGVIGGGGGGAGGARAGVAHSKTGSGGSTLGECVYIEGCGGGGGAGSISGSGGSNGSVGTITLESLATIDERIYNPPEQPRAGGLSNGASFTGAAYTEIRRSGASIPTVTMQAPFPGNAGGLGADAGDSVTGNPNIDVNANFGTLTFQQSAYEAQAGSGGNAIVQSGATCNIIVAGDIRGDIV